MLDNIEEYALENSIPIMQKDGIEFLTNFIKENNIKSILEIGSAIGYSAIKMALIDSDIVITTIERDEDRYNVALKNIKEFNLENRITIYNIDAFDFVSDFKFDLLFIDAAKAQNKKFFLKFYNNTKKYILTDNLNFHGITMENASSRNVRQLLRKINDYVIFLKEEYNDCTEFYDIGDGISITRIGE